MAGLDQQLFRAQPPANEVVEQHSRRHTAITAGDGARLIVSIPEQHREFDPHDTRESYERIAARYAEEIAGELANKPFDQQFLNDFAAAVGGGRIVELGCGPGQVSGYLATRGARVSGLDLSAQMIDQARLLFPELTFQVGDMLSLPYEDGSLAGTASFYSIVHFDESQTQRALNEMARVLARGGRAALAFHIGTGVIHRDEWFGEPVNVDFSFHEPAVVSAQLEAAGLTVASIHERNPYPPPIEFQTRRCYIVAVKP
jgi:SAM-dependent methyltransferase